MTLHEFNALSDNEARDVMLTVCGSTSWSDQMVMARPFASVSDVVAKGEHIWTHTGPADWEEAFAAHPRIGEQSASHFSSEEQKLTEDERVAAELARLNDLYYKRNGFIFIVFATGKTPLEMLEILQSRLDNDGNVEMSIAAAEQLKILKLRLQKLFA